MRIMSCHIKNLKRCFVHHMGDSFIHKHIQLTITLKTRPVNFFPKETLAFMNNDILWENDDQCYNNWWHATCILSQSLQENLFHMESFHFTCEKRSVSARMYILLYTFFSVNVLNCCHFFS